MSFSKNPCSELLIELSEEQQEFISGGEVYEFKDSYSYEVFEEDHSRVVNGQPQPENTKPKDPFAAIEEELDKIFLPSLFFRP